ncbi:MAG: hypothetical protein HRT57_09730 [Crocinitomicaceae bacterium]|nr:hypothetical protein [Crocinitomicaceae bacterium]
MLWKYNYHCPNCDHQLTNNNQIHFKVETEANESTHLYLSAVPGEYGYNSKDNLTLTNGDRIKFFCPSCNSNLQSKSHSEFIEVNMKVKEGILFEVFFSPVYGEQITYVMMEDELVKYHDDFFGEIEL